MKNMCRWCSATLISVAMVLGIILMPAPVLASGPIPPTTAYRTVKIVTEVVNITKDVYSGTRDSSWQRWVFSIYPPIAGWFVNGLPYKVGANWFVRVSRWTPVFNYIPLVPKSSVRKACMSYQGMALRYVPQSCWQYLVQ